MEAPNEETKKLFFDLPEKLIEFDLLFLSEQIEP
jgi:hypothetical protein